MTATGTRDSLYVISSRQGFFADAEKAIVAGSSGRITGKAALANGSTAGPALEALRTGAASAILLDLDSDMPEAMTVLVELCRLSPEACILAASSRHDSDLILKVVRTGAADFLPLPLEGNTLTEALERARKRPGTGVETRSRGQVYSFLGAKGGTGATTLAVNLAVALRSGEAGTTRSVVLIDMDQPGGDVTAMLKMTPTWSLADISANAHRLDMDLLGSLMIRHSSGVYVIPAADEGERPAIPEPEQVAAVITFLRDHFDAVILAGGGFSETTVAALNQAHIIHVVSSLDFLSLRRAQSALTRLKDLGVAESALRVVVNRHDRGSDLTLADAKEALGFPIAWSVPNDVRAADKAVNEGMPLVSLGKGRLQASFEEYAGRLTGTDAVVASSGLGGLFRRLVPTRTAVNN